jgi:hypothetical protein
MQFTGSLHKGLAPNTTLPAQLVRTAPVLRATITGPEAVRRLATVGRLLRLEEFRPTSEDAA